MIITFANHKGGVGKTTLAAVVAETLLDAGESVTMFDLDGQQNFTTRMNAWIKALNDKLEVVTFSKLPEKLNNEAGKYIVIDTPPGLGDDTEKAIRTADLVVVPCDADDAAVLGLIDIIDMHPKGKIIMILNKFDQRSVYEHCVRNQIETAGMLATQEGVKSSMLVIPLYRQIKPNMNAGLYWAHKMTKRTAAPFLALVDTIKKEAK